MMPMFSYNKISYEKRLSKLLASSFFASAKNNKAFAEWAADKIGLKNKARSKYIRNMLVFSLLYPKEDRIIDYVYNDLVRSGCKVNRSEIKKYFESITNKRSKPC